MPRARAALAWFVASLGLYGASLAPGPVWGDSAKLAIYALHGYWPSANPGDHPGLTVLARAWLALTTWLDPVRSLHLLCAVAGAVAVASAFLLVARNTNERSAAHSTAAVLLVCHPLWWSAAVTESYAPAVALALVAGLTVIREASVPRAVVAGLLAGFACAIHAFTLFLTVPLLLAVRPRRFPAAAAGLFLGAAPIWLALFSHPADPLTGHFAGSPSSWGWHAAAFLEPSRLLLGAATVGALLVYALGPIGLIGLVASLRGRHGSAHPLSRTAWVATGTLVVLLTLYSPFRLHVMTLLPLVALLLLVPPRMSRRLRAAHAVLQAGIYLLAPLVVTAVGLGTLTARRLPERDNARYFLNPIRHGDRGPERYAVGLLTACPEDAVVVADFNVGSVLRLVQERRALREDVVVVPTAIDEALAQPDPASAIASRVDRILAQGRPAVLADSWPRYYRIPDLERRGYRIRPCGPGRLVLPPTNPPSGLD